MKTCKRCGATLGRVLDWQDIVGQEHAKRAAEVALAGGHPIVFVGGDEAEGLAEWVAQHGGTAFAVRVCPCGNKEDPRRECLCTFSEVKRWQKRKAFRTAMEAGEIFVDVPPAETSAIERWGAGRRGETGEAVLDRVLGIGERPEGTLDEAGQSLMRAYTRQMNATTGEMLAVLEVARTVAALDHKDQVMTYHLAEAMQYRRRIA